ncbi:hypothetical protein B0H11DRAFT_2306193 [Mycena galericulata]|nr:hypothetical protein B0H11DRAFT_2306193 [Mycena galericulata]
MNPGPPVPGTKRRRLKGACDICKQRKIRCDSGQMPGNRCSNCISFNAECTHNGAATKGALLKESTPLQDITQADETAESHVATLISQGTSYIPDTDVRRVLLDVARYARNLENELSSHKHSPFPTSVSPRATPQRDIEEQDGLDMFTIIEGILSEQFDRVKLDSEPTRYFGKSSHLELINAAIEAKDHFLERSPLPRRIFSPARQPLLWYSPWEHEHFGLKVLPPFIFPEPDLLQDLVSLYFTRVNILLLLLHRPTFENSLADGLHLVDHRFGSTVLAVCALASKYTDDPRVLLEGTETKLSAGWKYFRQLQPLRKSLVQPISLYEAQTLCLCVCYLDGSSVPDACWNLAGVAIRRVSEEWKRVFWLLICIDIHTSALTTRPMAISPSDYDLDQLVECDDEYWDSSETATAFQQPPGKPSILSYGVAYSKLMEILGMAQRTIYLVKASDRPEGWPRSAVAALDSALNVWIDLVPDHLRWDPHMQDPVFATQSAVLYARYYSVQIHIHRIFIPSSSNKMEPSLYNYPSLAICASSARACSHVMNVLVRRGFLCYPHALNAVFDSCVILLLHVWRGRQGGLSVDRQKCLQDVEMCLRIFRVYETRWQMAGRQLETITELMSAASMDAPLAQNPLKREADPNPEPVLGQPTAEGPAQTLNNPVVGYDISCFGGVDSLFALPVYTEDLGRLPVYEPFNWAIDTFAGVPITENISTPSEYLGLVSDSGDPGTYDSTWANYDWGSYITNVEELVSALDNSSNSE